MNVRTLLCFSLFFLTITAFPQTVSGKIETDTRRPLPYASIGIVGRNFGTVAKEDGTFALNLDGKPEDDLIRISALGYTSVEITVAEFRRRFPENAFITLKKNVRELTEVAVRTFAHPIEWGNKSIDRREKVDAGFANNKLGNELGMVFKTKKKPVKLTAFKALLAYNHYKSIRFRLNVYAMEKGLPGASLLEENIIFTSDLKDGVLTVDLEDYGIVADGDFFVSLEWIEDLGEGGLHFVADYSGPEVITRAASQGVWNKQDELSFAFWVSGKY